MTYSEELIEKKYVPNVIIRIGGATYFSIRQPDSGLTVPVQNNGLVTSLSLNPSTVDPFRPSVAINSNSFKLIDRNNVVTALFNGNLEPPANSSGLIKIGNEFISYTGVSGNQITGCIRGEQGSTAANHDFGDDVFFCEVVSGNPIDLLLKLLISPAGGGPYSVLDDGGNIDQALIDVTEFETIRDEYFVGQTFDFILYQVDNLKTFIEQEILSPAGIRLRSNLNSKIGLGILNKPVINLDAPDLDDDQLTRRPVYSVDETKIVNHLNIQWGFDWPSEKFTKITTYNDAASVASFGDRKAVNLNFKGVTTQADVDEIAKNYFLRFAYPKPLIDTSAHMSASGWGLLEKPTLYSDQIPTDAGDLNFGDSVEVLQKAINYQTGDVRFQLSFTQFTGLRVCFIAPSDTILTFTNQKTVNVGAGRGSQYRVGWKMRLYSNTTRNWLADPINTIVGISGDTITFENNWTTTLVNGAQKITFADYDDVTDQQKRFCFISDNGNTFSDGLPSYLISY
ncbi:MAG: hypothetical protein EBR27_12045 [Betaproteobacteria bacterium]|nr:hypothetical protein [Betaproteobacteria bacterium]